MHDTSKLARPGAMTFVPYELTDPNFRHMRVATMSIPAGWRALTQVRWDFTSANYPVRVFVHVQSPDGKMWIDLLPMDAVYWMDGIYLPVRTGERAFGAVYAPKASIEYAMQYLVVLPARGNMPGFQVTAKRVVDAAQLAGAFHHPELRGEALSMRTRYRYDGTPVEEDFYAFYSNTQTVSYSGPWGVTNEHHRQLVLAHSVGATDGLLSSVYPLLGTVAASIRNDDAWLAHVRSVQMYITQQFNYALQQGYDQIAAAAQLSYSITANNDALLSSMEQTRAAQHRADEFRRAADMGSTDSADAFSQMIRGTHRMTDPYWGTSEQSNDYDHHWTDGYGNYRATNDAGFDPNVGMGGGASWQRMR